MSRSRESSLTPRAAARFPVIVFFGIAACCAACGQTGPLTLERPEDALPDTGSAAIEPDEPDEGENTGSSDDAGGALSE